MIAEFSLFCLCLAIAVAIAGVIILPLGSQFVMGPAVVSRCVVVVGVLVGLAFTGLVTCYLTNDFSVINVAMNVNTALPWFYKIASVWGNHEGSMLLWLLVLVSGGVLMGRDRRWEEGVRTWASWAQLVIIIVFGIFILATSNPFKTFTIVPKQGLGLNPLLQDPSLMIHPPILYMGLVGASVLLAWAWGAAHQRVAMDTWVKLIRPWAVVIWTLVTLGIILGSIWAYYELGWGGWWFWDPVENASFMPWLVLTALIHTLRVAGSGFGRISMVLAASVFPLSTLGTFLTRSGLVTSVHAFAQDSQLGLYLAGVLLTILGGMAWVVQRLRQYPSVLPWLWCGYRGMTLHLVLIGGIIAMILVGTVGPVILSALWGQKLEITMAFYQVTVVPLLMVLCVVLGVGVAQKWPETSWRTIYTHKGAAMTLGMTVVVLLMAMWIGNMVAAVGYGLATWVAVQSCVAGWRRRAWAMLLAHLGLALGIISMTAQTTQQKEVTVLMQVGDEIKFAGYWIKLKDIIPVEGPNYQGVSAALELQKTPTTPRVLLTPQQWFFSTHQAYTTETSIATDWGGDLYTALGTQRSSGQWEIKLYWNPLMWCLWLGGALIVLGGLVAFLESIRRRFIKI